MFPFRQKFRPIFGTSIKVRSSRVLENGIVEEYDEDTSKIVLPPPENYRLDVLLKAGIVPEQVNCKLINKTALSVFADEKTDDKKPANDNSVSADEKTDDKKPANDKEN